jgi:serine/threonine protein kinase/class 3 adenylate cyclase
MNLEHYQLLAQRGAGADGISYRAQVVQDGCPVEVRVLSGARADASRWPGLSKRLRLAALLDHPAALGVREIGLEHNPPYVVLEWLNGKSWAAELRDRLPLPASEAITMTRDVAGALAAAHRLGLAHGGLSPHRLLCTQTQPLKIDFTGCDTCTALEAEPFRDLDRFFRAPERDAVGRAAPALDIYSLGRLLIWLLEGPSGAEKLNLREPLQALITTLSDLVPGEGSTARSVEHLVLAMLATEPSERPSAREVFDHLSGRQPGTVQCTTKFGASTEAPSDSTRSTSEYDVPADPAATRDEPAPVSAGTPTTVLLDAILERQHLGRFRIVTKLGQGGMGSVYRAEDPVDGKQVAIKVLRADWAQRPNALRRFHKEARLLAEVHNPYVANLLEVNEDAGIHYLALELVEGQSLDRLLIERTRLDEPTALAILADVARALVDAHERGIVHRDIKPENILLLSGGKLQTPAVGWAESSRPTEIGRSSGEGATTTTHHSPKVKLVDFGLARHVVESESLNVTQAGALLGTPLYMAPEQCIGSGAIDARTDIYAMGATLFHFLAGRPPFLAANTVSLIAMHCNDPPPDLQKLNPAVSEGVCRIVEKCLAKSPEARYSNAAALLHDLERALRGEPTSIIVHPKLPPCNLDHVLQYDWSWELEASPRQLWPYVSNTERLNRAAGLSAVQFTTRLDPDKSDTPDRRPQVRRFGKFRKAGITAAWEEHPFEWIEAQRMGVLREYSQGPFKWLVSIVELTPRAHGGSLLTHRVRIEPSNLLGRTLAAVEVGVRGRRAVERIYRRIDAALTGKLGSEGLADAFEEPVVLSGARRQRLDRLMDRLDACGVEPAVVERFGDFLALASPQEVARIRPLALARRLGLDPDRVVAACLHGAREGLLILLWDILCPVCRIPSEVQDTLRAFREHGRCEACNLDFELDFSNSVEMIFRAHPEIRATDLGVYCIGGPAHSPHVVAQVRVGPNERIELDLALDEGAYRLRGPQLPFTLDFRVQPSASMSRWDLNLSRGPDADLPRSLKTGRQLLVLTNNHALELVARVERTAPRDDALTAARASALALFRELFPGEVLSPGQLVSVANVALLVTALDQAGDLYQELGDARAFAVLHEHFRLLEERIRREGGTLVKTVGEGLVAAFTEPVAAARAAIDLQSVLASNDITKSLRLRVGVHRGPAMAATLNGHLDYFGTTVNIAVELPRLIRGGELVLTPAVAGDPPVAALLQARSLVGEVLTTSRPGLPHPLHRVTIPVLNQRA